MKISINISLEFVSEDRINNILALVQIMAWRRQGDKPLSGPMLIWCYWSMCALLGLSELNKIASTDLRILVEVDIARL